MDHFLLIIILMSAVAFISICVSKAPEKEAEANGDGFQSSADPLSGQSAEAPLSKKIYTNEMN